MRPGRVEMGMSWLALSAGVVSLLAMAVGVIGVIGKTRLVCFLDAGLAGGALAVVVYVVRRLLYGVMVPDARHRDKIALTGCLLGGVPLLCFAWLWVSMVVSWLTWRPLLTSRGCRRQL